MGGSNGIIEPTERRTLHFLKRICKDSLRFIWHAGQMGANEMIACSSFFALESSGSDVLIMIVGREEDSSKPTRKRWSEVMRASSIPTRPW
jgi:hypothetical protein